GTHGLTALARALNLHPLALLEEALVLEAAGLIGFSDDGQTLRAIAPKPDEPDRGVTFTAEARAAARAQRDRSHG
ncbi:MAG TPA: hypothetical protein PKA64_26680, partial [Myxococcota bacterium]|nr:hypothetical protein [Myxococcota bacterium]